jgi:hypothetical protein
MTFILSTHIPFQLLSAHALRVQCIIKEELENFFHVRDCIEQRLQKKGIACSINRRFLNPRIKYRHIYFTISTEMNSLKRIMLGT